MLALSGCNWLSLGDEFPMNYALGCLARRLRRVEEGLCGRMGAVGNVCVTREIKRALDEVLEMFTPRSVGL